MSAVAIAPPIDDLETAIIEDFASYLHNDIVALVFCYTSTDAFAELAESLAAFLHVPIEEASNYLLPACRSAVRALEASNG